MEIYWVPGVNHLGAYGRWAFAEFTDVYTMESEFASEVDGRFRTMINERRGRSRDRGGIGSGRRDRWSSER